MSENEESPQAGNSYFESFAEIAAAIDALAKAVTPQTDDDGTPPDEGEKPSCNSYFASFRNIAEAIRSLKAATEARFDELSGSVGSLALAPEAASGGAVALLNQAVNTVRLDGTAATLSFPAEIPGRARSFLLRVEMVADTEWTLPAGIAYESEDGDVFAEVAAGETVLFFFQETGENRFLVARRTIAASGE